MFGGNNKPLGISHSPSFKIQNVSLEINTLQKHSNLNQIEEEESSLNRSSQYKSSISEQESVVKFGVAPIKKGLTIMSDSGSF